GQGEKGFCAGGDIKTVSQQVLQQQQDKAEAFFTAEYQLNLQLSEFSKPIIVWGDGIVMGGGMGLFMPCDFRIVTESSRLAMPEVSIGFFPDVGMAYYLNQLPETLAKFIAATGITLAAADALYLGIASHGIRSQQRQSLFQAFSRLKFAQQPKHNYQQIQRLLDKLTTDCASSELAAHSAKIDAHFKTCDIHTSIAAILDDSDPSSWYKKAQQQLQQASPLAIHWSIKHLQQSAGKSLQQVLAADLQLAGMIIQQQEFHEGVRARLIDKDQQAKWRFQHGQAIPSQAIEAVFS
ncbi:MAG: enoyl-CoA hydratase/isomerase family protein, partial [Pseudomonadales bacterium]|nr:enoyl-CoA hydratase/isomerase family protein [Pseudomonadales bacterium]